MNVAEILYRSPIAAVATFAIVYLVMLVVAGFLVRSSWFFDAVTPSDGRYGAMDDLRGVLAYGVIRSSTPETAGGRAEPIRQRNRLRRAVGRWRPSGMRLDEIARSDGWSSRGALRIEQGGDNERFESH